ncbi:hypothetical protein AXYL_03774 [Achromobacter xylosoxidans A8]|uniref:Transposase n=1 Tax=Achromobacter xylosoxidans (strain A8) TaxID=762376 RepID=E3HNQ5_ACHXA|nr:hypothetical protein AXYL_03774 [Achromobacter xylosoxidans A8]
MHAVGVLQKLLQDSIPSLHLSQLKALTSTVRSTMTTRRLTLSGLARGLPADQAIRHRIKRVDRLLGKKKRCQTELTRVFRTPEEVDNT